MAGAAGGWLGCRVLSLPEVGERRGSKSFDFEDGDGVVIVHHWVVEMR